MIKKIISTIASIAALDFLAAPALVSDISEVRDKTFNQSVWEGTKASRLGLGGFSKYMETLDPKNWADHSE